jgi:hypothetical protein
VPICAYIQTHSFDYTALYHDEAVVFTESIIIQYSQTVLISWQRKEGEIKAGGEWEGEEMSRD